MAAPTPTFVKFSGHENLINRLVLATLTGRAIHIKGIRSTSLTPGILPHEEAFLKLLDTITTGSQFTISTTGSVLVYIPGLISGSVDGVNCKGGLIEFNLSDKISRGVSYFLLPLCILAPFAKKPLNVRFSGEGVITSATEAGDVSVDSVRTAILPLYEKFGIPLPRLELKILARSCAGPGGKGGGGAVELRFGGQVRLPKTLHMNRSPGRIRSVKGVAYCTGVSNSNSARMIAAAQEVLRPLVVKVEIFKVYDPAPLVVSGEGKKKTGVGFGLALVAESSAEGVRYSADRVSPSEGGVTPEEVGRQCALQLLEIIAQGGCVTRVGAATVLVLMVMGSEDVGRLRLGRDVLGTEEVVGLGRDLEAFGASRWGLRDVEEDESGDIIVSVKGTGVANVGRKIQ